MLGGRITIEAIHPRGPSPHYVAEASTPAGAYLARSPATEDSGIGSPDRSF